MPNVTPSSASNAVTITPLVSRFEQADVREIVMACSCSLKLIPTVIFTYSFHAHCITNHQACIHHFSTDQWYKSYIHRLGFNISNTICFSSFSLLNVNSSLCCFWLALFYYIISTTRNFYGFLVFSNIIELVWERSTCEEANRNTQHWDWSFESLTEDLNHYLCSERHLQLTEGRRKCSLNDEK